MNGRLKRVALVSLAVVVVGAAIHYFLAPTSWQQDSECAAVFLYKGDERLMRSFIDTAVSKAIVDMHKDKIDAQVHAAVFGRV
jgi:hypothetical protein